MHETKEGLAMQTWESLRFSCMLHVLQGVLEILMQAYVLQGVREILMHASRVAGFAGRAEQRAGDTARGGRSSASMQGCGACLAAVH